MGKCLRNSKGRVKLISLVPALQKPPLQRLSTVSSVVIWVSSFQRVRRTSALRKLDHANDHRRLSRVLKRRASAILQVQLPALTRANPLSRHLSCHLSTGPSISRFLVRAIPEDILEILGNTARPLTFAGSR